MVSKVVFVKILHSAALLSPSAGILNQMSWEQQAAHQLRLDWDTRIFCPLGSVRGAEIVEFSKMVVGGKARSGVFKVVDWLLLRWEYHRWLKSLESSVDVFVLRHYVHDPFQLLFIARSKKPVYLVHHTLEVPELALSGSIAAKIRAALEEIIGKYSVRKSSGTVGVTAEIIGYENRRANQLYKKSILYPNGVMYSNNVVPDKRGAVPELLFVASFFYPWHGLDLLLLSMQKSSDRFILHLVGDISSEDRILAEKDDRVICHGRKSFQEVLQIAENCSLGLSSFALFRKNMKEASTLKVREYLMMGLPVYAGHQDTFPEHFQFFRNSDVNLENILQFSSESQRYSRDAISSAARRYIDKVDLLETFSNDLISGCDG